MTTARPDRILQTNRAVYDDLRHERGETREVISARRDPRDVAGHGHHVQGKIHVETLHGGAHARLLHRVQRAGVAGHAEPELAEGVPGESEAGQRDVLRAREPVHEQLHQGGRSGGPRAGGRHDNMENDRAE